MDPPRSQRDVWEAIAGSFDATRSRKWGHVEAFLDVQPPNHRVLDVMGGNGRHLRPGMVWLDWSVELARLAAPRHPGCDFVVADAAHLPFPDHVFDAAILVAGLHGISDPKERHAALVELRRVIRPGGAAQVTVWSRDAPRFAGLAKDMHDVVVPWRAGGLDESRHYHLYSHETIRDACQAAGWNVRVETCSIAARDDNLVATVW